MKNPVTNSRTQNLFILCFIFAGLFAGNQLSATTGIGDLIPASAEIVDKPIRDKATNFEVIVKKKGGKITGSHKRARKIAVYFDVEGLPETQHGKHELYLVIKDAQGMNIAVESPVNTKVGMKKDMMRISAQQSMTAKLDAMNRLKFEIKPKKKTLHKGQYTASVYSEAGLMGSTKFNLR